MAAIGTLIMCCIIGSSLWLSGKVFKSYSRGPCFEPHSRHSLFCFVFYWEGGSVIGKDTSEPQHATGEIKAQNEHVNCLNSLPNDKILGQSKLKAFAADKINMAEKSTFFWGRVENIVGKGENAGYQHFLLFPQCFQKASFIGSLIWLVGCIGV